MTNFRLYLKMNFSLIFWELVGIVFMGLVLWLLLRTVLLFILYPLVILVMVLLARRIDKKLIQDGLFGSAAAMYMSLPVGMKAVALTKILLTALSSFVMILSLLMPVIHFLYIISFDALTELCRNLDFSGGIWRITGILILMLLLFVLATCSVELMIKFWHHSKPLRNQVKEQRWIQGGFNLLIFFAAYFTFRQVDELGSSISGWLESAPLTLYVVIYTVVMLLVSVAAGWRCIRILERRYQNV